MVKKRRMKRGRKKIATEEKRRIKRVIAEKDNKNSDDTTQSINRAQHDCFNRGRPADIT